MSKAVLNKTAFSLKILVLFSLLIFSKVARQKKAEYDAAQLHMITASDEKPNTPFVPVHQTGAFFLRH